MGHLNELDIIYCYIDIALDENNLLFNRVVIHDNLSEDVTELFNQYGLSFEILGLAGLGGGALESLWQAIKFAWDNNGFIGILITLSTSILNKIVHQDKPTIIISLSLKTKDNMCNPTNSELSKRLINLKYINDSICNKLSIKYPIFKFDQMFGLSIDHRHFSVRYLLKNQQQNMLNNLRLLRLFKSINVRRNTFCNYTFIRWFLIKRTDGKLNIDDKGTRQVTLGKNYFFVFSTHVISDYLYLFRQSLNRIFNKIERRLTNK